MSSDRLPPARTVPPTPRVPDDAPDTAPDLGPDWVEGPDLAKEHVSTMLSTAAILAIALGVTWGLWPTWGPWALCVGGAALGLMVAFADWSRKPPPPPTASRRAAPELRRPSPPGPTDPGNLHTRGPGSKP